MGVARQVYRYVSFCCFILALWHSHCAPVDAKSLSTVSNATYWQERNSLMAQDLDQMLGHDLSLTAEEEEMNTYLMSFKEREVTYGFNSLNYSPSINFLEAKPSIENSPLFKIIHDMPKGAALHTHDMALTSIDWVVSNLTYWDDLYMCNGTNNFLYFKFFTEPDSLCDWRLVSNERALAPSTTEFDSYLHSRLSLSTTEVEVTYPDINSIWEAFEQVFTSISGLITYSKAWESYLARALQEFMDDNVSYMEFRGVLPLLYEKDGTVYTEAQTVEVYKNVIEAFTDQNSANFFGTRFIYAPPRLVDVNTVWGYVNLTITLHNLYPTIVAGFDLVGQEDLGNPLSDFVDPILYLKEQEPPIPVFFHAGETDWEGLSSDENLFDALLMNSSRIGHGYALAKHPQLIQMALDNDVPIEVCPISNQVLMLLNDLRNHPAAALASKAFPMVVSSDDPAIWEALPLSHDFYEAFLAIGGAKADLKFLKKLVLNSIRYSSLEALQKISLEQMWQQKWDDFIHNYVIKKRLDEAKETNIIPTDNREDNAL